MNETKIINQSDIDKENAPKRDFAQKLTFAQIQELVQRNVTKNVNKRYTQFSKDNVKTYLQNPATNLSNIIDISRFLERNSMLYKKIISYYASTPLFYYNLVQDNDLSKKLNGNKIAKDFYTVAKTLQGFDLKKEMYDAIYCTVRDGMYVAFQYGDDETSFLFPLDIKYCRIYGQNTAGQWIVYFDKNFFNGDNKIYVEGIDGDTTGCWDQIFIDGYNDPDNRWFRLPPERTFCLIAGTEDQFDAPLPTFAPLMVSLMELADIESIIASKTELENYKMIVSKIPLRTNSDDNNDFLIDYQFAQAFNAILEEAVPDLVATVTTPMDIDTVEFKSNARADDTDALGLSVQNLFNNAGVSQLVVAGGSSSNSVGLKYSILNDLANIFVFVNRIESWMNFYIQENISEGYRIKIHPISWMNREDYQKEMETLATLGGSAMDMLTSHGDTPYEALQKLNFENALGVKSLMTPLSTSYTQSGNNTGGRPEMSEDDLSESGAATRSGNKNEGTKANG